MSAVRQGRHMDVFRTAVGRGCVPCHEGQPPLPSRAVMLQGGVPRCAVCAQLGPRVPRMARLHRAASQIMLKCVEGAAAGVSAARQPSQGLRLPMGLCQDGIFQSNGGMASRARLETCLTPVLCIRAYTCKRNRTRHVVMRLLC